MLSSREREVLVDLPDRLMEQPADAQRRAAAFGARPVPCAAPAPAIGQHNAELLASLGYTEAEIEALAKAGVLGHAQGSP